MNVMDPIEIIGLVITLLQEIRTIAKEMGEYEPVCDLLCGRLDTLTSTLKDLPDGSNVRELLTEYLNEVEKFRNILLKYREYNAFRRLWSHRKIMANIRGVTDKITSFEGRIHIMVVVKVEQVLGEVKIGNATADETLQEVKSGNSTVDETLQEVKNGNVTANQTLAVVSDLAQLVEAGVADILQAQERTASDTRALRNEARQGKLAESTTMIRYELDNKRQELPARHIANLERAYSGIEDMAHPTKPTFSNWFISPNDIDYDVKTPFALGGFGQVHHGTWTGGAEVVIKVLLADDENARKMFKKELDVWYSLDHPHINHLYGACDSVSPPFFVSEEAKNGDFVSYFEKVGRAEVWRLFYEAALGLNYLHNRKVIHGDLKCNNLLVGTDNRAKICDFGFSYVRTASVGMSAKAQAEAIRFKAPETMIQTDNPDDYNPRRASDVYSFGLCIWEAFEGEPPFGTMDDDEITEKLFDSDFEFPAPKDLPDEQWEFVKRMLAHNWKQRVSLYVVIDKLCEYKDAEANIPSTIFIPSKSTTVVIVDRLMLDSRPVPEILRSISEKCRVGPSGNLCIRVHKRLEALSQVLNGRDDLLGDFRTVMLAFLTALRWQHQRPFLYWFSTSQRLVSEVRRAHMGIDAIYARMGLQDENPVTQAEWAKQRTLQESKFTETFDKTPITILKAQVNDPAKLEEIRLKLGKLVDNLDRTPVIEGSSANIPLDPRCSVAMLKLMKRVMQQLPQPSNYSDLNQDDWNQMFAWHIPREDVTFLDGDGMPERGTYGVLRRAEWTDSQFGVTRRDLVAKTLIFNTDDTAINFSNELRVWSRLRHDNVLNMLGANHVSREKFFLSERATANFANFFSKPPCHMSRAMLWDLFRQAAAGLNYLHSLNIEHGGLKCSNILVFEEGATEQDRHYTTKLSDFGFSVIRNQSAVVEQQAANYAIHWRAPERLQQQPDTVGIDFESSDVYSLGLCIVEAVTGQTPFGDLSDSDLIDAKFDAETYPRPGQLFTDDDEWALVARMTSREPANRPSLDEIISEMTKLAALASL